MKNQSPLLTFDTSAFPIGPGEDEHTNPGIFGKALAEWIAGQVSAAGFPTGEVFAEDFGWCVPVPSKPYKLYVACMMTDDEPHHCKVFAFVEGGWLPRVVGRDERADRLGSLYEAVRTALESAPFVDSLEIEP